MNSIVGDQLRSYIDRAMRLEDEIRDLNADKSEVFKEAKSNGFDTKVMRALIRRLRSDQNELFEFDNLLSVYEDAYKNSESDAPARVHAHTREAPEPASSSLGADTAPAAVEPVAPAAGDLSDTDSAPDAATTSARASAGGGSPPPPPATLSDDPFTRGRQDYDRGLSGMQKPYKSGSPDAREWTAGWLQRQGERAEAERQAQRGQE